MRDDHEKRQAMRNLRASLHSLDDEERADLRAALDQAEEDLKPPPPPRPFACVEQLDWRFHSSTIQAGSIPGRVIYRGIEALVIPPNGWRSDLQVGIGNVGVDVRLRGHGLFSVRFVPHSGWRRHQQPHASRLVWEHEFNTIDLDGQIEVAVLPLTSITSSGHVQFFLHAHPDGWEGDDQ